jgi:hypothetical protein
LGQFAVLITHTDVVNTKPTLSDLHAILAKYQRREAIFLLAKLNCLLGTWQNTPAFDIDARLSILLLPHYQPRIVELRRSTIPRLVFSRMTLLYLVKQVCLVCGETGLLLDTAEAQSDIGLACLMVNDLLLPYVPTNQNSTLGRLASLLPFSDYISKDQYEFETARSQEMFDQLSQSPTLRQFLASQVPCNVRDAVSLGRC